MLPPGRPDRPVSPRSPPPSPGARPPMDEIASDASSMSPALLQRLLGLSRAAGWCNQSVCPIRGRAPTLARPSRAVEDRIEAADWWPRASHALPSCPIGQCGSLDSSVPGHLPSVLPAEGRGVGAGVRLGRCRPARKTYSRRTFNACPAAPATEHGASPADRAGFMEETTLLPGADSAND